MSHCLGNTRWCAIVLALRSSQLSRKKNLRKSPKKIQKHFCFVLKSSKVGSLRGLPCWESFLKQNVATFFFLFFRKFVNYSENMSNVFRHIWSDLKKKLFKLKLKKRKAKSLTTDVAFVNQKWRSIYNFWKIVLVGKTDHYL